MLIQFLNLRAVIVIRNILCCITAFFLSVNYSYGQHSKGNITGRIKDKRTKEAIPGASILLEVISDSSYKKTAISSNEGGFSFSDLDDGMYTITVTYLGYKKYKIYPVALGSKDRKVVVEDIELEENDAKSLKEVVVRSEKKFVEQRVDKLVVNVDALLANTGTTAFDALNNAPGVTIDDGGSASLRGKESVKVFIDDKPSFLTGRALVNYLKSLPSGMVDKIEIMSNPPARYSADGTGGIINIRTKKMKTKGFNGNINVNYSQGAYSKSNNTINFNYRNDKLNVFGSAGYSLLYDFVNSDRSRRYNFKDTTLNYTLRQHYFEKSRIQSMNYKLGADYTISDNSSLGVMVSNSNMSPYKETGRYRIAFEKPKGSVDSTIYVNSGLDQKSRNFTANLNYRHRFNTPGREVSMDLDYLNYRYEQNQLSESTTHLPDNAVSAYYNLISENPFRARIYGAKADYIHQVSEGIKIETGAQTTYSERNSEGIYFNRIDNDLYPTHLLDNKFKYKENINAIYVSFNREYGRMSMAAGLRMENTVSRGYISGNDIKPDSSFRLTYTNLFPNAYFSYNLDTGAVNVLTLSAGRRITRPGYQELNPSVFFFDRYTSYMGNPLLMPEYATNFELSYSNSGNYNFTLSYSHAHNASTLIYEQVDSAFIAKPVNVDAVTNLGINTNISIAITKWWNTNLYMELVKARYKGVVANSQYLDNSRSTLRLTGSTKFTFGNGWSAEMSGLYKNRMVIGQAVLDPAWRMNAALQKKVLKNKGTITLTGQDIFRSWIVNRDIFIPEGVVSLSNTFDTHRLTIGFIYRFGTSGNIRERKSGIQNEQRRVDSN